jgi:hypothetical protein
MPISADNSPNIKHKLPAGQPAFSLFPVFPSEMFEEVKQLIQDQVNWGPGCELKPNPCGYHTITGKWNAEIDIPQNIWDYLENLGRERWGKKDLRLKTVWLTRYQQYNGSTPYLWEHLDHSGTQYTIDICIDSPGVPSWGLLIDGQRFEEGPNNAVFFMGQQQPHSRPPYPVDNPDAHVVLLFANLVDPSHWAYDIDIYDPTQEQVIRDLIAKYKLDGDIRYYEITGHAPRFDNIPPGNVECGCPECTVVSENFIDEIEGYVHLK